MSEVVIHKKRTIHEADSANHRDEAARAMRARIAFSEATHEATHGLAPEAVRDPEVAHAHASEGDRGGSEVCRMFQNGGKKMSPSLPIELFTIIPSSIYTKQQVCRAHQSEAVSTLVAELVVDNDSVWSEMVKRIDDMLNVPSGKELVDAEARLKYIHGIQTAEGRNRCKREITAIVSKWARIVAGARIFATTRAELATWAAIDNVLDTLGIRSDVQNSGALPHLRVTTGAATVTSTSDIRRGAATNAMIANATGCSTDSPVGKYAFIASRLQHTHVLLELMTRTDLPLL